MERARHEPVFVLGRDKPVTVVIGIDEYSASQEFMETGWIPGSPRCGAAGMGCGEPELPPEVLRPIGLSVVEGWPVTATTPAKMVHPSSPATRKVDDLY